LSNDLRRIASVITDPPSCLLVFKTLGGTIITEEIRRRSLDSCSLKINKIDNGRNSSDDIKVAPLNQNLGSNDKHVNIQEVQNQGKTTEVITVHNSSEENNCIDKQEDKSVIEDINTVKTACSLSYPGAVVR
jgi:hypothetical protein